jgi:hypothetical protein
MFVINAGRRGREEIGTYAPGEMVPWISFWIAFMVPV